MGRPKGSLNKKKTDKTGNVVPIGSGKKAGAPKGDKIIGVGHNSLAALTDDQQRALLLQGIQKIEVIEKRKAQTVAELRNERKKLIADGFTSKQIDFCLRLRDQDPKEAAAEFAGAIQVAHWLAHPIGRQMGLFEDVDRTPGVERAYEEGKTAGMEGASRSPPYDASTQQGQQWLRGHADGQAVLMKGFKPIEPKDEKDLRPRFNQEDKAAAPQTAPLDERAEHALDDMAGEYKDEMSLN